MKTDSMSNQLRWVILLLAAAVILPTVCLLWFMNQAVKNVTYSARQNIVDFYQQRIHESVVKKIDQITVEKFDVAKLLGFYSEQMAQETFRFFIPSSYYHEIFDGFVVYNSQGRREWPVTMPFEDETDFYPSSEPLMQAWKEEFEQNDPNAATLLYQRIIVENQELDDVLQIAQMGLLRCLTKTHRWNEAITLAHQLSQKMNTTQSRTILYLQSSVQLAELYKKTNDEKLTSFLKYHLISPAYYQ